MVQSLLLVPSTHPYCIIDVLFVRIAGRPVAYLLLRIMRRQASHSIV